jgi:hypothetical protein
MTVIVGIVKNGTVWLGGDSAGTNQRGGQKLIADPKVFVKDDIAFGVCGSPKVMDRLRHATELPSWDGKTPEREFLIRQVVPTIKSSLEAGECLEGSGMPGALLIGFRGHLYQMQGNFQLITTQTGFDSVGCGADIALGSLHSTVSMWSTRKRVITALTAACAGNSGCRPPFVVVKV